MIFLKDKLEELMKCNWTTFLDRVQFLRQVLGDAQLQDYPVLETKTPGTGDHSLPKVSITKANLLPSGELELWAEFSVPTQKGPCIGTHLYHVKPGKTDLVLKESYGTVFSPKA